MGVLTHHSHPNDSEYRREYERGWRWAPRMPDAAQEEGGLNYADRKGWTNSKAWVDGFTDFMVGDGIDRAKWHSWHSAHSTETECVCVR